jgi:hypothetical protein
MYILFISDDSANVICVVHDLRLCVHAKPFLLIAGVDFGLCKRRKTLNLSTAKHCTVFELICTNFSLIPLHC